MWSGLLVAGFANTPVRLPHSVTGSTGFSSYQPGLGVFCHELIFGVGNRAFGDSNDAFGTLIVVAASSVIPTANPASRIPAAIEHLFIRCERVIPRPAKTPHHKSTQCQQRQRRRFWHCR